MALNLINLNDEVRKLMLSEFEDDLENGKLYCSKRLSSLGINDYSALLRKAIQNYDDNWLSQELSKNGRLNTTETTKKGTRKIPYNASITLAEGEFNRYYIRGICLYAINNNINTLSIYRAKQVENPRIESQLKIGKTINPTSLLNDLRSNIGTDLIQLRKIYGFKIDCMESKKHNIQ